ncbi:MAG: glycosyl hydrolase [Armatimonadetes bacterium]|nr:glycosyl hydrolase [Armatimonadota bacterium]
MLSLALTLLLGLQDPTERQEPPGLDPDLGVAQNQTKKEQDAKFHKPDVVGMPASVRMAGYDQRLRMEGNSPFQRVMWRSIGPEVQGGRVIDIDSPLDKPRQTLVAYATGGLWRTEDDGVTWTSLFDNQSAFSIGDFAVSRDGNTIWVGTGENNSQRTSYSGTGVFKSTDAGKTWNNVGLPESHHIGRILIDPRHPDTVWVAVLGHLYSQNPERGVYKTTDGGKTWSLVLKKDVYTGAVDLTMDPRNGDTVYASLWDRDRRSWDFREGGPGTAVYKTTDAGKSWTKLKGVPCDEGTGRIGLAVAPSKPDTVYAFLDNQNLDENTDKIDERQPNGRLTIQRFKRTSLDVLLTVPESTLKLFLNTYLPTEAKAEDVIAQLKDKKLDKEGLQQMMLKRNPHVFDLRVRDAEVWRSDDAGKSWKFVSGRLGAHGGYYGGNITVDPKDPNLVYTCGLLLLRSRDGGAHWESTARESHVDFHVVYIDPRDPNRVWEGCDGGLYFSGDKGDHWRIINNLAVGQFTTIAVDDKSPYNVYGGLQDNGTMKGPSNYVAGRSDPNAWTSIGGGDGSAVAVDPRNGGDIVYYASQWGDHAAVDQKTNERWSARAPGGDLRYNWISPILISPHHPDIVYLGSQKLHRSFNQGKKYEALSGDLTKNRPVGNVPHSSLTTISESPFKFGVIYVGTDDGNVKMTPDGGNSWVDIMTPQPQKWVTRIVASKFDAATVYCSQNGYREDDFTAMVWMSKDYGKTWISIAGDLPCEPVNTVREDPNRKDILWVGTDMGVYVTFDEGSHWVPYGGGLPHTPVHDLAVQPRAKEMVVASHARSVWAVSVEPAYDLTEEIRKKEFHFWPVSDVTWSDRWGIRNGGEWDKRDPDEPKFTVKFWTTLRGKGKLVLKDKDGKEVKSVDYEVAPGYNWASFGLMLKPGNPDAPGEFIEPKTADEGLRDPYAGRRAQYVGKGDYTIEVQVGGKVGTVKVKVS